MTVDTIHNTKTRLRKILTSIVGDANHKSHYLYETLPVKSNMAFLSRILILLAILLYEQYKPHTKASICPKVQFLRAQ